MGLFKRKQKSEPVTCPRCSQLVFEEAGSMCPTCGWDIHDAYQGPPVPTADDAGEPQSAGARSSGWDAG
jgi:hypothetical protein